ncbi:MAG: hypothetical protein IT475_16560, partial [Aquimonas sp.]|nr:hypothetical protein [Aquimonas sp.]
MKISRTAFSSVIAAIVVAAGLSTPAYATFNVAQAPLYLKVAVPPLNMLVLGKDHKNYYEAYNDASDLNGDGELDVGYKPDEIDYYGYFNSRVCYSWNSGSNMFTPSSAASGTNGKRCSGMWSGDFLNYLTTGRLDALRKVLYGGYRNVDTDSETVLQGAFFPQDAHSWGKEYQSIARDGYNIADYAPLGAPGEGRYHLFAVTTVTDNSAPLFRVHSSTPFRVWNWVSKEGPVANRKCLNEDGATVDCNAANIYGGYATGPLGSFAYSNLTYRSWQLDTDWGPSDATALANVANSRAQLDAIFAANAVAARQCGAATYPAAAPTGVPLDRINQGSFEYPAGSGNWHTNAFVVTNGACSSDFFITEYSGFFTPSRSGNWAVKVTTDNSAYLEIVDTTDNSVVKLVQRYRQSTNDGDAAIRDQTDTNVPLIAGRVYSVTYRTQAWRWRGGVQKVQ